MSKLPAVPADRAQTQLGDTSPRDTADNPLQAEADTSPRAAVDPSSTAAGDAPPHSPSDTAPYGGTDTAKTDAEIAAGEQPLEDGAPPTMIQPG